MICEIKRFHILVKYKSRKKVKKYQVIQCNHPCGATKRQILELRSHFSAVPTLIEAVIAFVVVHFEFCEAN